MANAAGLAPQRPDNNTDGGLRLRRARERLDLKFRDVETASQGIAERHGNQEFVVLISRLSEIESRGTVPSIFRLYSLCCIYRLNLTEVMGWYGVSVDGMAADSGLIRIAKTHGIGFPPEPGSEATIPISLNPGVDLTKTFFLSHVVQRWGKLPLALLGGVDHRQYRYAFMGTQDWSMHPLVPAGSLLVIDESKRRIQMGGWNSHVTRPIYFLEHRDAFYCRWCSLSDGMLSLIPDPASDSPVTNFRYPEEIEVVGQVVGLAISLDLEPPRRTRP